MTLKSILSFTEKFVTDNSPGILTGLAVAGTVTTAVLTGKAGYSAALKITASTMERSLREPDADPFLDAKTKVDLIWKEFIPAAVTGVATVTCIIAANRIGSRRTAAIAAAFKLSEQLAEEYKAKVVEKLGVQKEEKIRSELARDRMDTTGWKDVVFVGGSSVLFYDELSGRFFQNEKTKVDKAVNDINHQINNYYHASLSDFYEMLGLNRTSFGEEVGWNSDQLLDVKFAATLLDDDKPAIGMTFRTTPIRGYDRCN